MEQAEQTREEGMTRQRLSPQSKAGSKTSNDAAVLRFSASGFIFYRSRAQSMTQSIGALD